MVHNYLGNIWTVRFDDKILRVSLMYAYYIHQVDKLKIFLKHFSPGLCPYYISMLYAYHIYIFFLFSFRGLFLFSRSLKNKIEGQVAARRAASLPLLLCHGKGIYACEKGAYASVLSYIQFYLSLCILYFYVN